MGISFGGINTGLPPNLVDQLVEAERQPIKQVEMRKSKTENKLKLVGELEEKLRAITGKIGTLASNKGFSDIKLESGDPNVVQGTVDPDASVNGSWNVEVVELAQKSAAITNGFPDKDKSEIGVGYFKFETPEGKKEVYISGANNTLEGAATAINNANIGVRASVINDRKDPDSPFKLMITGINVGGDSSISYPTLYFLDGDRDLYFDEKKEAKNGVLRVDGIEFEIADNKVEDAIPGVTLDIKQATPGKTVNISVKENREVVSGKIKEFVDATNAALTFLQSQSRVGEKTDTSQTLGMDGLIRNTESRLRQLFQNSQMGVQGPIKRFSQLGIEFNRSGMLEFKEEKFNKTLAQDPASVQAFFAGDGFNVGFIPALKRTLNSLMDPSFGPIQMRKTGFQNKVKSYEQEIERKERYLARREETLKRQFSRLEETMSKLKSQGGALSAMSATGMGANLGGAQQG